MTSYAYFNHHFVPTETAVININTHALHYGCGYFGGIRGYWNQTTNRLYLFRLDDHLDRFFRSGQLLDLRPPADLPQLKTIILKLVRKNRLRQNFYIRPLVFVSDPILSKFDLSQLHTSLAVTLTPLGNYLNVSRGIKVIISSWKRQPSHSIPPQAKPTGIYLNTALAHTEAKKRGYGEAILLNLQGFVAEGSAENIFLVKNNQLITPDANSDILLGITRKTIIELAQQELDIKTIEKSVLPQELVTADEVFLTGTGAQITPVYQIDQQLTGTGRVGPITRKLQRLFSDIVYGRNPKYHDWLTPIKYTSV